MNNNKKCPGLEYQRLKFNSAFEFNCFKSNIFNLKKNSLTDIY